MQVVVFDMNGHNFTVYTVMFLWYNTTIKTEEVKNQ
mgnify:CR=1 FL=1